MDRRYEILARLVVTAMNLRTIFLVAALLLIAAKAFAQVDPVISLPSTAGRASAPACTQPFRSRVAAARSGSGAAAGALFLRAINQIETIHPAKLA